MSDRFIVAESSGYPINIGASGLDRSRREVTEVMVLDRGYCHRVVWSSVNTYMQRRTQRYGVGLDGERIKKGWKLFHVTARRWSLARRRAYAADLAARLNAEDVAA